MLRSYRAVWCGPIVQYAAVLLFTTSQWLLVRMISQQHHRCQVGYKPAVVKRQRALFWQRVTSLLTTTHSHALDYARVSTCACGLLVPTYDLCAARAATHTTYTRHACTVYALARCSYSKTPVLRLAWLEKLAQLHLDHENWSEAGMAVCHIGALIAE
jgi:hypothetical protein